MLCGIVLEAMLIAVDISVLAIEFRIETRFVLDDSELMAID